MTDNNKKIDIRKILKGKALYIALAVFITAAGVAGYMAADINAPVKIETEAEGEKKFSNVNEPVFTSPTFTEYEIEMDIPEYFTEEITDEISTAAVFDNEVTKIEKEKIFFTPPLKNAVGKDFSMGLPVFSETMKDYRTHNGVDFSGVKGDEVCAVGSGTVTEVKKDPLWGNTVTVDHGDGIVSYTSGLSDTGLIETGTEVHAGSIIGLVGVVPVEKEDASHIHLEIRKDGKLYDPLELMGLSE